MRKFYLLICLVIVQLVTYGQNRTFDFTNVKTSASRTIVSLIAADTNDSGLPAGSITNVKRPTLAATGLSKGDLAVIGMNGDIDAVGSTIRSFALVALNTIAANEVIFITDRGWINTYGSTPGHFVGAITTPRPPATTTNEGILQWTPSVTITAGTIIIFKIDLDNRQVLGTKGDGSSLPSSDFSILSDSWTNTNLVANPWPPAIGDQLIIYQGSESSPSFIFAFNNLKSNATNVSNGWNTNPTSIEPPTQLPIYSELPSDLGTTYSTAFLAPLNNSNYPNVKYNPSLSSGSKTTWLADITNTTKWESAAASNPYNFSLGFGNTAMTQFQVGSLAAPVVTGNPPNRIICLGGNTTFPATVTNATSYQWQEDSGSGFVNITNAGVYSNATTATLTITGATAGMSGYIYRLVATGTGGSATSNVATLSVINITATTSQTNVSCNGGSNGAINLTPAGGTAPYTFNWGGGITTEDRTGLVAGTYTVIITDANGCTSTVTASVTQPNVLEATVSQTNVSCNGGTNGTATVVPAGGIAPYTYSWSPSGGTGATANSLAPGTYTVTVTDANSCSLTTTVTFAQPAVVAAPTGTAIQSFNAGDTLSALVANGQSIKWYASQSNATNHTNSLPLSTPIVNNTTYYATQTSGICESTASLAVLAYNQTLSVESATETTAGLQIYPNPVSDILKISGEERISKFVISSLDGKKITEKILKDGERGINVSSLVQGTYLIQVFTKNHVKSFKFLKK